MIALAIALCIAPIVISVVVIVALTWEKVSVRRCECSERIAEIENGAQPNPIGFSR